MRGQHRAPPRAFARAQENEGQHRICLIFFVHGRSTEIMKTWHILKDIGMLHSKFEVSSGGLLHFYSKYLVKSKLFPTAVTIVRSHRNTSP